MADKAITSSDKPAGPKPIDAATSSPSAMQVERLGAAKQQDGGDGGGDQRRGRLGQAAVGEAAHQPVEGVVEGEGRGGERQRQAGRGPGGERNGEAGEQQRRRVGAAPGQRDQQGQRAKRSGRAAGGKRQRLGEAEPIAADHRAERGAARCAADVGRGEGVGEHRLQAPRR